MALSIQDRQKLSAHLTRLTDGNRTAQCLGVELFCDLRYRGTEISGCEWLFPGAQA